MTPEQIDLIRFQFKEVIDSLAEEIAAQHVCSKQEVLNILVHQGAAILVDLMKEASHAA
jgi:hypothetical protein